MVAFARPDAGQGRVMAHVDLVLDVEVGARQEGEELGDVRRDLVPQVGLDQGPGVERGQEWRGVGGERRGRGSIPGGHENLGRAQEDLAPEPFPTQSSRSAALCSTVQVERLQT